LISILLALFILLVGTIGYGFYLFKANENVWLKPDLKSTKTTIKEITADSMKAQVTMTVRNSLPFTIRIDSLSYVVALDGDTLIQGSQHQPTELRASSDGQLTMPMNTAAGKLMKKVKSLQRDSADVYMRTTMYSHFPVVGTKPVPVEIKRTIYIPKLPKVEVEKVKVDKLGLKESRLITTVKITNYESFPFTIKNFRYHFRLSDNIDVKGKEDEDIHFKKTGTETIDIPIKLTMSQVGEAAFKLLFKSETTPYRLNGQMQMSSDQNFIGNVTTAFNSEGTVEEMKNLLKQATEGEEKNKQDDKAQKKTERKEADTKKQKQK
jgi:LEA14-like dessication related protein